VALLIGLKA
jgi:hypothetical protein